MDRTTTLTVTADTAERLALAASAMPLDLCCNCGRRDGLVVVGMPLPVADLAGESVLSLPTPHCPECIHTAKRVPPRFGRMVRLVPLSFLLSAFLVAGASSAVGHPLDAASIPVALLAIVVLAVALPWLLLRWRPPRTSVQTSRYQAVRITLKQSFFGKIERVTFAFTNPVFAERYGASVEAAQLPVERR